MERYGKFFSTKIMTIRHFINKEDVIPTNQELRNDFRKITKILEEQVQKYLSLKSGLRKIIRFRFTGIPEVTGIEQI